MTVTKIQIIFIKSKIKATIPLNNGRLVEENLLTKYSILAPTTMFIRTITTRKEIFPHGDPRFNMANNTKVVVTSYL